MDAVMRDWRSTCCRGLERTRQLADAIDFAASAGVHHGMMAPCDVILKVNGPVTVWVAQALIKAGTLRRRDLRMAPASSARGAPPTLRR
jgi:hypothetical protein